MSDRKPGYSPLNAENSRSATHVFVFAYEDEKINILLSVLSIFLQFLFYGFKQSTQALVHLEFVKYQLGLHRNEQVFAKCNVCISAIQLLFIRTCQRFLPISFRRQ